MGHLTCCITRTGSVTAGSDPPAEAAEENPKPKKTSKKQRKKSKTSSKRKTGESVVAEPQPQKKRKGDQSEPDPATSAQGASHPVCAVEPVLIICNLWGAAGINKGAPCEINLPNYGFFKAKIIEFDAITHEARVMTSDKDKTIAKKWYPVVYETGSTLKKNTVNVGSLVGEY